MHTTENSEDTGSKRLYRAPSAWKKVLMLMMYTLLAFVIANFAAFIPLLVAKIPSDQYMAVLSGQKRGDLLMWVQLINSATLFGIPVLMFALYNMQTVRSYYHLDREPASNILLMVIALAFASMPLGDLLALVNEKLPISTKWYHYFRQQEDGQTDMMLQMVQLQNYRSMLWTLVVVALAPAFFEEMFFRGALQTSLIDATKKPWLGILLTAVIFSAVHRSYFGFLPRFYLGAVLGYVYWQGKNMWLNMTMHFINNAVSVVGMFLLYQKGGLNAQSMTEPLPVYYQWAGLVAVVCLLYFFRKKIREKEPRLSDF